MSKLVKNLRSAIQLYGLEDGMTVSFHHNLRSGDTITGEIMRVIAELGIKDLTIAPSSLLPGHDTLIPFIEDGTITRIQTSGVSPKIGKLIQQRDILNQPVEMRTHGSRSAAFAEGKIHVDIAFVAASHADKHGNCNSFEGASAFGSMGYSMVDAAYADKVVVVTDNLSDTPVSPVSINQSQVNFVVQVESIGDPKGIATASLSPSKNPLDSMIAELTAHGLPATQIVSSRDNRKFINGVFWILRTGAPWQDLPSDYGDWKNTHCRFYRRRDKGGTVGNLIRRIGVKTDKGSDTNAILEYAQAYGIKAVILPKRKRKNRREYDKELYKQRHLIENAFLYLKRWRGIAARYAKNASSFLAAIHIRCISLLLPPCDGTIEGKIMYQEYTACHPNEPYFNFESCPLGFSSLPFYSFRSHCVHSFLSAPAQSKQIVAKCLGSDRGAFAGVIYLIASTSRNLFAAQTAYSISQETQPTFSRSFRASHIAFSAP